MNKKNLYIIVFTIMAVIIIGALAYTFKDDPDSKESEKVRGFPPPAPILVSATPGIERVTLTWQPVNGATSYNIYWSDQSSVALSDRQKINRTDTRYVHTGLVGDAAYHYTVTAINSFGEGPASREVTAVSRRPYYPPESEPAESETKPTPEQLEAEFHRQMMNRLMELERPRDQSLDADEQAWFPEDEIPPPGEEWPGAGEPTWDPNKDLPSPRKEWPGVGEPQKWSPHDELQLQETPF